MNECQQAVKGRWLCEERVDVLEAQILLAWFLGYFAELHECFESGFGAFHIVGRVVLQNGEQTRKSIAANVLLSVYSGLDIPLSNPCSGP